MEGVAWSAECGIVSSLSYATVLKTPSSTKYSGSTAAMFVERTRPDVRGMHVIAHTATPSARKGRMCVLDQVWDAEAAETPVGWPREVRPIQPLRRPWCWR